MNQKFYTHTCTKLYAVQAFPLGSVMPSVIVAEVRGLCYRTIVAKSVSTPIKLISANWVFDNHCQRQTDNRKTDKILLQAFVDFFYV